MAENPRIEELRRRVHADPASIAFAALAEEYRRAGRPAEAVETCLTGLQRHPSYLSARVTLGRSLIEVGRLAEAREELTFVLRAAPENLAAIRGLAEIHQRRGEIPEALDQYKAALQISQHDPELQDTVERISRTVTPDAKPEPAAAQPSALADWALPPGPAPADARVTGMPVGLVQAPNPAVLARLEQFLAGIKRARTTSAARL